MKKFVPVALFPCVSGSAQAHQFSIEKSHDESLDNQDVSMIHVQSTVENGASTSVHKSKVEHTAYIILKN